MVTFRNAAASVVLAALIAVAAGCGRKGPPVVPKPGALAFFSIGASVR